MESSRPSHFFFSPPPLPLERSELLHIAHDLLIECPTQVSSLADAMASAAIKDWNYQGSHFDCYLQMKEILEEVLKWPCIQMRLKELEEGEKRVERDSYERKISSVGDQNN